MRLESQTFSTVIASHHLYRGYKKCRPSTCYLKAGWDRTPPMVK